MSHVRYLYACPKILTIAVVLHYASTASETPETYLFFTIHLRSMDTLPEKLKSILA